MEIDDKIQYEILELFKKKINNVKKEKLKNKILKNFKITREIDNMEEKKISFKQLLHLSIKT
jgi:hypothetical protein